MTGLISKIMLTLVLIGSMVAACAPAAAPVTPLPTGQNAPAGITRAAWETEWEKIVGEAKKEGKLMVYSSQSGAMVRQLGDAFRDKFGIQVDFVVGRGEEITQKMQMEKNAGLNLVDVIISGSTLVAVMKPQGLLGQLEPLLLLPEVTDPKAWITGALPFMDKDRTSMAMAATFQRYVFRNTELVKEGEITSYKDVLNPKWKGKMVLDDPTTTGSGNAFFGFLATSIFGVDETREYMRQLVKQEPAITRDKRLTAEWVARGKYHLGLAPLREAALEFMKLGAPVNFVKVVEGGKLGSSGGGLGVPVNSPHPNATRLFVNWVLSREGHAEFVKAMGQPGARVGGPREGIPPELFPDPGEKVFLESEEEMLFKGELTKMANEVFAPLLR